MTEPDRMRIESWLKNAISECAGLTPVEIRTTLPFDRYGLDSVAVIGLGGALSKWLARDLDPMLFFDYPTIDKLVDHLDTVLSEGLMHHEL